MDQPAILYESNPFSPANPLQVNEQTFKLSDIKADYDMTHQLFHAPKPKINHQQNSLNLRPNESVPVVNKP
jgi:hypothetical protein